MGKNAKQAVLTALKLGVALSLIVWLVTKGVLDIDSLKRVFSWPLFLACFALDGLALAISSVRWWLLLKSQGIHRTWKFTFSLTLIGNFFNFALPGGVGGDLVKGYYLIRDHQRDRVKSAASILLDRVLGFYVLFVLAYGALWVSPSMRAQMPEIFKLVSVVLAVATTGGLIVVFRSNLVEKILRLGPLSKLKLDHLINVLHDWSASKNALLVGLGLSVVSQVMQIFVVILTGMALGADIPLLAYFLLVPLASACTVLPLAPAGVGVGQAAAYFLFHLYSPEHASVGPIGFTIMQTCLLTWGLGGAFLYIRKKKIPVEVTT
jgi:uncharacterized protein (TIRG00374 family)